MYLTRQQQVCVTYLFPLGHHTHTHNVQEAENYQRIRIPLTLSPGKQVRYYHSGCLTREIKRLWFLFLAFDASNFKIVVGRGVGSIAAD